MKAKEINLSTMQELLLFMKTVRGLNAEERPILVKTPVSKEVLIRHLDKELGRLAA
jgi:hypothetical protein